MSKLAVTITAASLCAGSMVPLRAQAMTFAALASLRPAIDGTNSVEKAACGWYPADYPQSWAVYTRGWGCRQVYSRTITTPIPIDLTTALMARRLGIEDPIVGGGRGIKPAP